MSYEVLSIPPFDRQLKRLAKKYPSLKSDYSGFVDEIAHQPKQGKALGKNCYKMRMAITSKGKGKSGGARIITHLMVSEKYNTFMYGSEEGQIRSPLDRRKTVSLYASLNLKSKDPKFIENLSRENNDKLTGNDYYTISVSDFATTALEILRGREATAEAKRNLMMKAGLNFIEFLEQNRL